MHSQLLLLLMICAAPPGPWAAHAQSDASLSNGCAAILRAAVYRSFYLKGDTGPYAGFENAVCSLPSTDLNELVLPLSPEAQAAFQTAAAVLVPRWGETSEGLNGPGLSTSNAYKVVRDFHVATCKVRQGRAIQMHACRSPKHQPALFMRRRTCPWATWSMSTTTPSNSTAPWG